MHPKVAAFDAVAPAYSRGRPDYPPALSGWLRETVGLSSGSLAVDLGAGTGKFTPLLIETGARVLAVEPVAGMRAELARSLPQVEAREGTAEALPLDDGSVDVVACAQAFHWFATPEALAEIARVLRPDGRLALVWNVRDDRVPWVARLGAILDRHEGDAPRHADGRWRALFPARRFGPLHEADFAHVHSGDPVRVLLDRVASISFIAALPPAERAAVLDEVRALIDQEPVLSGRPVVDVPYVTRACWSARS